MDKDDYKETHGACPTQEELEQYAFGKADASLSRKVEEHMTSCDLCADVVDGLMLAGEKDYRNAVFRVNADSSDRSKNEPKSFFFSSSFMRIAAGVLLAFSTGYFLFWKCGRDETRVAENIRSEETQKHEPSIPASTKQLPADTESDTIKYSNSFVEKAVFNSEEEASDETHDLPGEGIMETSPIDQSNDAQHSGQADLTSTLKKNAEKITDDVVPVMASEDVALPAISETSEQLSSIKAEQEQLVSTKRNAVRNIGRSNKAEFKNSASPVAESAVKQTGSYPKLHARVPLQFFKDRDWQSAYDFGKDLMHLEPNNDTAIYIAAVSALRLGKQSECLSLLSILAEMQTATFHRPAELQRALQMLADENKKDAATKLLKNLSLGTDSIAKRAGSYLR